MRVAANPSSFIQLSSGRAYPFATPGPIPIEVIARSLSRICRFGGHLREFYSVAQHSYLVASLVAPELRAHALLHDAGEVVIGDIVSPLKDELDTRTVGWLREFEDAVHASILRGLGRGRPPGASASSRSFPPAGGK